MALEDKRRSLTLFCFAVASCCTVTGCTPSNSMNEYGHRVKYKENQDLLFPDFTLRYIGKTKVVSVAYSRGFTFYHFVAKANGSEQKIRWSSGTGDIAPLGFSANGKPFWLELQASDKFGALAPDELIVSPHDKP